MLGTSSRGSPRVAGTPLYTGGSLKYPVKAEGHVGLNMALAAPVLAFYPGSVYDAVLWLWFAVFVGVSTWPDLDLKFELKHRGFTHTIAGALVFGAVGALVLGLASPSYAPLGFLGGFFGTLCHVLGDLMTYTKFRPLWPLTSREYGWGLFAAKDERINRSFRNLGAGLATLALTYRMLLASPP